MFNYKKYQFFPVILLFLLVFSIPAETIAGSIKDRMAARIPAITSLKDKGAIGENNKGYLEFRSKDRSAQKLISAENGDRKKVYSAIAKKQNVSPQLVGQRRAKQIAAKGKGGHWFQDSSGKWFRK